MNKEVTQFLQEARDKGMTNEQIMQLLVSEGWPEAQAQATVLGLHVPSPQTAAAPVSSPAAHGAPAPHKRSIGALEAALQHVLLWVFTGASTIMVGIVSFALFGPDLNPSSEVLLAYLVVEVVTFIPFTVLFLHYLRKFRRHPNLTTGKVWSILTIVFHSLGLIAALIGLILVLVLVHNDSSKPATIYSIAMVAMNSAVLAAYVTANFINPGYQWRKYILNFFPVALFVVVAVFGLFALTRVGPLKTDDATRQQLINVVEDIRKYVKLNDKLPETLSQVDTDTEGVTYSKKTNATYMYQLCASFKVDSSDSDSSSYYNEGVIDDSYVYDGSFMGVKSGEQCFDVQSYQLYEKTTYPDDYYEDYDRNEYAL